MSDHAQFSPSAAHRWMRCPGSHALESRLPPERDGGVYAAEGTAAHEIASQCLLTGQDADAFIGRTWTVNAGNKVYKFDIDATYASYVQVYIDFVRNNVMRNGEKGVLLVEQRVPLGGTMQKGEQFGTSDCIIIWPKQKHMLVGDLKFGQGVEVFAKDNEQMMLYAWGAIEHFELADFEPATVTLAIIQPRRDHIDVYPNEAEEDPPLTLQEMLSFRQRVRDAVMDCAMAKSNLMAGESIRRYLNPSDKACLWCPLKASCEALAEMVSKEVIDDFGAIDNGTAAAKEHSAAEPMKMHDELLGHRLGVLDLVEAWVKAVREEGARRIFEGAKIEGPDGQHYKIVEGRSNRVWSDPKAAREALEQHLGDDAFKPREIISPAVAEKLLNRKDTKKTWGESCAPLIFKPPGKPTVALGSDKRPEYHPAAGLTDFIEVDELST